MGHFIHLLHTLQGTLNSMEGNFLVNDKGDFIIDHNNNFIELYEKGPEPPPPPMGDPHVSVIGDIGTNSSSYVPTYNYYCYSLTQQIYTAAEIDFEGYITGIVFYPRGNCQDRVLSVFLSPISNTSFTNYYSVVISQDDIVLKSKTVTVAADTPIWLQFDTPYYYAGDENLLVTVKDDTGSYDSSINFDIMSTGNLYQALYIYTDSAPYNPSTQNDMSQLSYKNAIQLLFNNAEPVEPIPDLPTENYFMLTNHGNDTNIEINSANRGNVFINDVYAGRTGNTYSIPAGAVIKITNLRATGSYEHSSIYTTDTNANLSVDRWDESIAGDPSYVFSGQSGIRSVNSWYGAQNYTGLSYTFYKSTVETVDNWSNLTYLNKMDRTFIASQLRSIPSRWYGLDAVHILDYAFSDTKLTSLPTSWDGLNNAESMRSTFFNCTLIQSGGTQDIESLWQVTDTDSCFGHCSSWTVDIEPMYNYLRNKNITVTSHANMFYDCSSADNYRFIPTEWGGLGEYRYEYIEVGGRSYKVVTIGNQKWMAENLDYKFPGLNVADTNNPLTKDFSTPNAAYYNYDEATYGINGNKFGLMYNYTAAKYLNDHLAEFNIPNGWHVPSKEDIETLFDEIGDRYTDRDYEWVSITYKLISTEYWKYPGTDDYHFGLYPAGECRTQGANYDTLGNVYFESVGYNTKLATVTEANNSEYTGMQYYFASVGSWSDSRKVLMQYAFKHFGTMIRLVKNLT